MHQSINFFIASSSALWQDARVQIIPPARLQREADFLVRSQDQNRDWQCIPESAGCRDTASEYGQNQSDNPGFYLSLRFRFPDPVFLHSNPVLPRYGRPINAGWLSRSGFFLQTGPILRVPPGKPDPSHFSDKGSRYAR